MPTAPYERKRNFATIAVVSRLGPFKKIIFADIWLVFAYMIIPLFCFIQGGVGKCTRFLWSVKYSRGC